VLKGYIKNISILIDLCRVLNLNYFKMLEQMVCYIMQSIVNEQQLPTNLTELRLLSVEQFTQLEIPDSDFQETDVF
ncbi:hypothetical protein L873DRAFT_1663697, partial [Choiromyces venosus 120613-1]